MLDLCKDSNTEVVRNAALALSLAAYCQDNVDRMGEMVRCVPTLLHLCNNQDDSIIHAQALVALANLAYSHTKNQVRVVYSLLDEKQCLSC